MVIPFAVCTDDALQRIGQEVVKAANPPALVNPIAGGAFSPIELRPILEARRRTRLGCPPPPRIRRR